MVKGLTSPWDTNLVRVETQMLAGGPIWDTKFGTWRKRCPDDLPTLHDYSRIVRFTSEYALNPLSNVTKSYAAAWANAARKASLQTLGENDSFCV